MPVADVTRTVAYFSMEIGLSNEMPTYSGGLGVLAGDTIRSAADLRVPMVAVTLLHRKGYFAQGIGPDGKQIEEPATWQVEKFLQPVDGQICVDVEGRCIQLRAWRYDVRGVRGGGVPVYLLDANLPDNREDDRTLTDQLYGGDSHYRFLQEVILGIGGVRLLRKLGHDSIRRFHMNEGHSSFLTLELLSESMQRAGRKQITQEDIDAVRERCVFTTHTPVPAGHDQFPIEQVRKSLKHPALEVDKLACTNGMLNMTYLALNLSRYINGVAKKHGEVSRSMFPNYEIQAITNGVHCVTWAAEPFQKLFDKEFPGWREDNLSLRNALRIAPEKIEESHREAKAALLEHVSREAQVEMSPDVLTIGFARRMTAYKRPALIFSNIDRLKEIADRAGKFQIVFAGKAHPRDQQGKDMIRRIHEARDYLKGSVTIAFLKNYDMKLGGLITSGVDIWLNTPKAPLEASGTSGMKAALNGVPSFSVLDGWWIEGCIEGVTGWAIGDGLATASDTDSRTKDAQSLYEKLENVILPLFYKDPAAFATIRQHCIAINGSFFNTQRMMQEYAVQAYL